MDNRIYLRRLLLVFNTPTVLRSAIDAAVIDGAAYAAVAAIGVTGGVWGGTAIDGADAADVFGSAVAGKAVPQWMQNDAVSWDSFPHFKQVFI